MFTNLLFFLTSHYPISNFLVFQLSCSHRHSSHFLSSHVFFSLIITLNSSWLISMSLNAWDTKVSMLSSLLLDNIRILSCFFFLFLVMLSDFLIIPFVREKKYSKTCTCYSNWCSNFACRWHDTNSTTCCAWKH